ncbi:MAG: hypothetical protein JXA21_24230 [Anaerolineae bacterium]|nr:hypothetical protein [Anaerolineae bacterium]
MTPTRLAEHARSMTARWVLWGYVTISVFSAALYTFNSLLHHRLNLIYVIIFLLIGSAAGVALFFLGRSLELAMQSFAWVALVCVAVFVVCEAEAGRSFKEIIFMFHVGIFTIGLILGYWPAMRLAIVTTIFLVITGVVYNESGATILASVLACALALPAKVVERLIQESTQELSKMNAQLRQEIGEREKAQAELKKHQDHLEELVAQRTAALTEANLDLTIRNEELDAFAHTVAHDLKSPLATLIGFSSLLEGRYARMDEEQRQYAFGSITNMGRRMNNIVQELLLLSSVRRLEDLALDPVDMASVTQEAVQRLYDMVNEYHANITFPDSWPSVWSYAPWLEEVWVNYISNAIKYGGNPSKGVIPRIELGFSLTGFEDPSPDPQSYNQQGSIMFWVHDNGKGLREEDRDRLFTPFTRLEQVRAKGHGLGLSIVKRIVERLNGEVGVTSDAHGSTFYFTLPNYQIQDAE